MDEVAQHEKAEVIGRTPHQPTGWHCRVMRMLLDPEAVIRNPCANTTVRLAINDQAFR